MEKVLRIAQHRLPLGKAELVLSFPLSVFARAHSHSTLNSISGGISVYSTCSLQPLWFTCVGVCVCLCDLIICCILDTTGMSEPRLNRARKKTLSPRANWSALHTRARNRSIESKKRQTPRSSLGGGIKAEMLHARARVCVHICLMR